MRAKRAGKLFKLNCRERKFFGKFCTFRPNSSKLRSDYLISFQKRTNYLFPALSRSEYVFQKSASPPPPPRIKWSSPKREKSWELNLFLFTVTEKDWHLIPLTMRHKSICWRQFKTWTLTKSGRARRVQCVSLQGQCLKLTCIIF